MKTKALLFFIILIATSASKAQIISTIAGNGTAGYSGNGSQATAAEVNMPECVAFDAAGNMYIADFNNNVVRKVNTSGVISTFAGNGTAGYSGDGSLATSAELNNPTDVLVDHSGNVYITDYGNSCVRKVNISGNISTIAGTGSFGYSGDGGAATAAQLYFPQGITLDNTGNLYIADVGNYVIRKVNTSGIISTIAGNGTAGYSGDGGQATSAELSAKPTGITIDGSGNLLIADTYNYVIRKVNPSGVISTIAGDNTQGFSGDGGQATSAELNNPAGITVDTLTGNLYINDGNRVRLINASNIISTIVGNGTAGFSGDGSAAISAEINTGWARSKFYEGNLYITDANNNRIRKVGLSSSLCSPNITTGLVANYEVFGNADDTSGNGNNGVNYGASLSTDRFGNPNRAYSFNGTTDSIVVPNSSSLQFSSDNQSISFWMDLSAIPNPTIQDEGIINKANENLGIDATGSSMQGFKITFGQGGNGTITYAISGGYNDWASTTINNSYLTTNQWMFMAFTYDNSKDSIFAYFNGTKVNSAGINTNGTGVISSGAGVLIGANTMPLLIGKTDFTSNGIPAYLFSGKLSDVRLYGTPLTACDVDSLFNMPNPVTTGISSIENANNGIAVYPNPTNGAINISGVNAGDCIEVYNSMGQKIETKVANASMLNMDISGQTNGIYLTRIISKDGSSVSQKIIIKTN